MPSIKRLTQLSLLLLLLLLGSGCGNSDNDWTYQDNSGDDVTLASLTISPSTASIGIEQTQQFKASATLSDNSTLDLTEKVSWSSSNSAVASIDSASGLAKGVSLGKCTIKASIGGVTAEANLSVLPSLNLSEGNHSFDTDSGLLDGNPAPGWNASAKKLSLQFFKLDKEATLNLSGSETFKLETEAEITLAGNINFKGATGTDGVDTDQLNGVVDGTDGENGGDIDLSASGKLTVSGTIDLSGGNGGNGGNFTSYSIPYSITGRAGKGGQGGNSGQISFSAPSGSLAVNGATIIRKGGLGGNGGDLNVTTNNNGTALAGEGGNGGSGTLGGNGGKGGTVTIATGNNETGATATAGKGGNGGQGSEHGGNGGNGGSIIIVGTNSGTTNIGLGGSAGAPDGATGSNGILDD